MISKLLAYITNHVVAHVPSFTLRHFWYRWVLGVLIGQDSSVFMSCTLTFYRPFWKSDHKLRIGANTIINRECLLDGRGGLTIGNNVSISPQVALITSEHLLDDSGFAVRDRGITIQDRVWIGTRATVLPGVSIGEGAVVAAGAVVHRDVPPYSVVGGVPARVLRGRSPKLDYQLRFRPLFE